MSKSKDSRLVVGIDLGGTNMQIGVVDPRKPSRVIGHERRSTHAPKGAKVVIDRIVVGVKRACRDAGVKLKDISAAGIAAAGAVDIPRGVVLDAPNLRWKNLPLGDLLEKKLGCPVVVDNDVNGAVWGESRLGAGRGRGDVLGVWVGTGVGGGLVLNGRMFYGEFFTAGEVGQTVLFPSGKKHRRTVEDYCSRTGMARTILARLPEHKDSPVFEITNGTGRITGSKQFRRAIDMGCDLTKSVVDEAADLLGIAIANWITVLALDSVILGGGVSEALGESYLQRIRKSFRSNVFPDRCRRCKLLITQLADNAGLLGAALLAAAVPND